MDEADFKAAFGDGGDPYAVLGVSRDASPQDVRSAYRRKLREHRPESDPEGFQRVRQAYEVLREGGFEYEPVAPAPDPLPREPLEAGPVDPRPDAAAAPWRDREGLRDVLRNLDAHADYSSIQVALNREFGEDVHRDPDGVAEATLALIDNWSLSSSAVAAVRGWIEQLDTAADWVLDSIDDAQLRAKRRAEAKALRGRSIYPAALIDLLVGASELSGPVLERRCAEIFDREGLTGIDVKQANRQLREGFPELWASWNEVRDVLVDLSESRVDARARRARAWDVARSLDGQLESCSNRALAVVVTLVGSVVFASFRFAGVRFGAAMLIAVMIASRWLVPWLVQRRFEKHMVPVIADALAAERVTMADLYWVLVERSVDFQNWSDVVNGVRDHLPLWCCSAEESRR